MKKLILFLFIICCNFLFSQDWLEDQENLKGHVKSINYNSIVFKENTEDNWIDNFEYHYNAKGFLIQSDIKSYAFGGTYHNGLFRIFDEEGVRCLTEYNIIDGDTTSKCNYEYDSILRVKKGIYFSDDSHCSTFNYLYNKDSLVIECFVILQQDNDTIRYIYEYDKSGYKIKETHLGSSKEKYKIWQYDQKGNLVHHKSFEEKSPTTTVYTIYEDGTRDKKTVETDPHDEDNYIVDYVYNESNQVIREVRKYLDDSLYHSFVFTYNEIGDVLSKTSFNDDGSKKWTLIFEYLYDIQANWISKTATWEGVIDQKEERKIEYY